MRRDELARRIDHTLLAPEASRTDIERLADAAAELGCASACVHPSWVGVVAERLARSAEANTVACSVAGFPSGAHLTATKVDEARRAVDDGAAEIDVVVHLGLLLGGEDAAVGDELSAVRAAVPDVTLKVIVESGALADERLRAACSLAVDAGADFVKTSTGFHPSGGATLDAVATMREVAGTSAQVKASGGIRTSADALAMLHAGADRMGCSATAAILDGLG